MASKMFYSTPVGSRHTPGMMELRRRENGIVAYAHWMALREMCFEAGGMLDMSDSAALRRIGRELEMKPENLARFCDSLAALGEIDGPLWNKLHHVAFPAIADELAWIASKTGNASGTRP